MNRPIHVDEINQNLKSSYVDEDIITDPQNIRRYFTSNIFQRCLSHLFGRGNSKSYPIRCTEAGALHNASIGGGFNYHSMTYHTMTVDTSYDITFDPRAGRIDLWVYDNDAMITFSGGGSPLEDYWLIEAGAYYSFDVNADIFSIKNATAGANTRFRVVAFQYNTDYS